MACGRGHNEVAAPKARVGRKRRKGNMFCWDFGDSISSIHVSPIS
jgi:hypothetical protein